MPRQIKCVQAPLAYNFMSWVTFFHAKHYLVAFSVLSLFWGLDLCTLSHQWYSSGIKISRFHWPATLNLKFGNFFFWHQYHIWIAFEVWATAPPWTNVTSFFELKNFLSIRLPVMWCLDVNGFTSFSSIWLKWVLRS